MPNNSDAKSQTKSTPSNEAEGGCSTDKNIVDKTTQVPVKQSPSQIKYQETPYRWYVMVAYCLTVFANGFQWVTFSSNSNRFFK